MKLSDIHIRDPFVLKEGNTYYLYGTRAKDFGKNVGGHGMIFKAGDKLLLTFQHRIRQAVSALFLKNRRTQGT